MLAVGLLQGPPQHWFYLYLDKFFPGTSLMTVAKKIVIDQCIASPFCIVLFFSGMGVMEGKTIEDCKKELYDKFLTVYIVSIFTLKLYFIRLIRLVHLNLFNQ